MYFTWGTTKRKAVSLCCSVLQCVAVCGSVWQGVAVCCSVLQCVVACCSVLQCVHIEESSESFAKEGQIWRVRDCIATVIASMTPRAISTVAATHCNTLQHTATHCTTLHHTATHCNTLQHTATHCYQHRGLHTSVAMR